MRRNRLQITVGLASTFGVLWLASVVAAQDEPASQDTAGAPAATSPGGGMEDVEAEVEREVDVTAINLPTTMRLPKYHLELRITHRFLRGLKTGSFSDLASDFFGIDGQAQVGVELRFGLTETTQFGVQRISDRTIEPFLQQELIQQRLLPIGVAARASVEGINNFQRDYSPCLGLVFSHSRHGRGTLYVVPMWVGHTRLASAPSGSSSTFVVGLGARLRVVGPLSVLGEYTPRVSGYKAVGSRDHFTAGAEMRVGGHCFQLSLSNDPGTTPAAVARGQVAVRDWFVGFNLTRKFF